jgi:hypothetical protein
MWKALIGVVEIMMSTDDLWVVEQQEISQLRGIK